MFYAYITKVGGARGLYPLEIWKIGKTTPLKIPPVGPKPPYRKKFQGGSILPQKNSRALARAKFFAYFAQSPLGKEVAEG